MALYSLNFYIPPLVSLSPVSLTKSRCSGVLVNLPNLSLLLHTHSPNLSSSCFRKPIPAKISIELLRATAQQKYVYPDPIPEFAEAETQKFRDQLLKKLLKDKATFGDDLHTVVDVCVEVMLPDFIELCSSRFLL
uniref:Protein PLASTID REDOX INSENSITIVE 2, chloroplastic-like n=1 Tax=Nelumbo nucifera TaxID=4432 RepID=A0A822YV94_NELNU|nr:TPA_asm: hypothetical protein HUJ06_005306 [Nelumbo nucifera]